MGLFDKLKKKVEEGVSKGAADASKAAEKAEADVSKAAEEAETDIEEAGADSGGGGEFEKYEWQYYYKSPDNWGGMKPNDLDEFMARVFAIEEADGAGNQAQVLSRYGYRSKDDWLHVQCTFYRYHFGQQGKIPPGDVDVNMADPRWMQAGYNARMRQVQASQQAAVAANPNLTAPVEGITVEQWAAASAKLATMGSNPTALAQALAQLGMDKPKYDRVNAAFQAKMQGDTTGAIATIFGQAFSQAQGVAGGFGQGTTDGSAQKLGAEPMSLEKYAEIGAAMDAWARQGADVNANLKQVFGMTAADYSKVAGFWSTKFAADVQLMMKFSDMQDQFKAKYAGADLDDDLDKV